MRVWHFSANDCRGGAAQAAYCFHECLRKMGHESRMMVSQRATDDSDVQQISVRTIRQFSFHQILRRMRLLFLYRAKSLKIADHCTFNRNLAPELDVNGLLGNAGQRPDVIVLYWLSHSISAEGIRDLYEYFKVPIVWVLLDSEPYTGGCHYVMGCDKFKSICGACPRLGSSSMSDLSRFTWNEKKKVLGGIPITFIAPTLWLLRQIKASSLFGESRIENLPLPIGGKYFKPFDKAIARQVLRLPQDSFIILAGCHKMDDPRKGMGLMKESLELLAVKLKQDGKILDKKICCVFIGNDPSSIYGQVPFAVYGLGYLQSELDLSLAYQASDVFVSPSIEDAGPMMLSQSMLCGTPVVAFRTTGIAPEIIKHMNNGYLVDTVSAMGLAEGIYSILTCENRIQLNVSAAETARSYHEPGNVVEKFKNLLTSIIDDANNAC